ncbi:MAG: Gfo/Idh/MocA family oxidoreductase [Armatimonadetes bacterium]|nr:Gfo/Idh/MocA family oxidoreductase [Armatimonadota bacterium]
MISEFVDGGNQEEDKMDVQNNEIRIGIVGLGMIGSAHLSALCESRICKVVAGADVDPTRRQNAVSEFALPRCVEDYRELLDSPEIDLIIVGTPHQTHCAVAVDSLEAGKHVIVDKPLAGSVDDTRAMLDAAERSGMRLFVAHNHRFMPSNQLVRSFIRSGAIGDAFLGMSCFIGDEYERMSDPNSWKGSLDCGGGVLLDNGVHMIDILRSFFGDVSWVNAVGYQAVVKLPAKGEDTGMIQLGFDSGPVVSLVSTFVARYNGFPSDYVGAGIRHDFYGDRGSLHVSSKQPITLCDNTGQHIHEHGDAGCNTILTEDEHFIECILDGLDPIVTAVDGFEAIRVVEAAYESMKTGRRVSLAGQPLSLL